MFMMSFAARPPRWFRVAAGLVCLFACAGLAQASPVDLSVGGWASYPRVAPGGEIGYTIIFGNVASSNDASQVDLTISFPQNATCSWRCERASIGASIPPVPYACPSPTSGNGLFSMRIAFIPRAAIFFYSARCTVGPNATGSLAATATLYPAFIWDEIQSDNNRLTITTPVEIWNDVAVTTTDSAATAEPGGFVVHDATVRNNGTVTANDVRLVADFPADETCTWTCSGDSCPATQGLGDIDLLTSVPAYGRQTFTADCDIAADATGTLTSTASVAFPAGVTDMVTTDNTASDTTSLASASGALSIGPDANWPNKPTFVVSPERVNVITWRVDNNDTSDPVTARVTLDIPPALVNAHWHCDNPRAAQRCSVRVVDGRWVVQIPMQGVSRGNLQLQTGVAPGPWESIELNPVISVVNGIDPDMSDNASSFAAPVSLFRGDFERPSPVM